MASKKLLKDFLYFLIGLIFILYFYGVNTEGICSDACSTCIDGPTADDTNCLTCNDSYYIIAEESETNCILESKIPRNYYKNSDENKYHKCHENCASCDNSYDPVKKTMYCIECVENFFFEEGTTNCFSNTHEDEGFILLDNTWFPCYKYCKKCSAQGEEQEQNCISCLPENYKVEGTNNCFPFDYMNNKPYYLDFGEETWKKCYRYCQTCVEEGDEIHHNCQKCLKGDINYHFVDGEERKNCFAESFVNEGYYLDEESDTYYKCPVNCTTCNHPNENDSNCISCKVGYYLVSGTGNCFDITFKKAGYFLSAEDSKFYPCFDTCSLCSFMGNNNDHNCDSCKENLYFEEGTNNCYDVSHKEKGYYLSEKKFYPCFSSCQKCNELGNSNDHKCLSCKPDYFFESNTNNCYDINYRQNGYYLNEDNLFKKCFEKCDTCSNEGTNDIMNCETCISNYYLLFGSSNCYDNSYKQNSYFIDPNDNKFHKCFFKCKLCSSKGTEDEENNIYNHNCITCIENYYLERNTNNCYNMTFLEKGYYLDTSSGTGIFEKCFQNCKTCSKKKIGEEMNCILCISGYYKINGTDNCYDVEFLQANGYYFKDNYFHKCSENCVTCSDGVINTPEYTSNNCLSCDNNKGLYLVNELNNCENIDYNVNGYYLKEKEDGVKIFYKCYKTCELCSKGFEIDEDGKKQFNCDICIKDTYKLENTNNCYGDEMRDEGKNLVRGEWKLCYETCEECEGSQIMNDLGEVKEHNCKLCYHDYHFIYNTTNCENDSILEMGYYYDEEDQTYHECDVSCQSCEKTLINGKTKCISCNNKSGYYPIASKPESVCYNFWNIEEGYYLYDEYDENTNTTKKKWGTCYEKCNTCTGVGNDIENLCTTCVSHFYKIHGTTNCAKDDDVLPHGYYFNNDYKEYVKCYQGCLTCEKGKEGTETNCNICDNENGYYIAKGESISQCYNSETIGLGFFLNKSSTPKRWEKCYERCETCQKPGNKNKMFCSSCKKNYVDEKTGKLLNLVLQDENCNEECSDNLYLSLEMECVKDCPEGTYKFHSKQICIETCPEGFTINSKGISCVAIGTKTENITATQLISKVSEDIFSYISPLTVIDGQDFKAQVMTASSFEIPTQLNAGISAIDLRSCIELIKKNNDISSEEDIIILNIEYKQKNQKENEDFSENINLGKGIEIHLFDNNKKELNLDLCSNSDISVLKQCREIKNIDIIKAKRLFEKGINVFDPNNTYFNDICTPFSTEKNTDITLKDRRNDYYQNISFCEEECIFEGFDYSISVAKCLCKTRVIQNNTNQNKGITYNHTKNVFKNNISYSNLLLIKCIKLILNLRDLKKNIGFFLIFSILFIQILLLIIFLVKGMEPLKIYMLIFEPYEPNSEPFNPPPKKIISFEEGKKDSEEEEQKDLEIFNISKDDKNEENENKVREERNKIAEVEEGNNNFDLRFENNKNNSNNKESNLFRNINSNILKSKNEKRNVPRNYSFNPNIEKESIEEESIKDKKKKIKSNIFNILEQNNIINFQIEEELLSLEKSMKKSRKSKKSNRNKIKNNLVDGNSYPEQNLQSLKDKNKTLNQLPQEDKINEDIEDIIQNVNFPIKNNKFIKSKNFSGNINANEEQRIIHERSIKGNKKDMDKENKEIERNEQRPKTLISENNLFKHKNNEGSFPKKNEIRHFKKKKKDSNSNNDEEEKISKFKKNKNYKKEINETGEEFGEKEEKERKKEKQRQLKRKKTEPLVSTSITKRKETKSNSGVLYSKLVPAKYNKNIKNSSGGKAFSHKNKKVEFAITNEDFLYMDYENAKKLDKRTCKEMYCGYLSLKHSLSRVCITDYLNLKIVRVSIFFFSYSSMLFFNALFFTDKYISNIYKKEGTLDILFSLPKSIYSYLATFFLVFLLRLLSNSKNALKSILNESQSKIKYNQSFYEVLKNLKVKLVFFYIFVFILTFFFWHYISVFCIVYQNSQLYWLYGCAASIVFDIFIPLIFFGIFAYMRYKSINNRHHCLYSLLLIINKIL